MKAVTWHGSEAHGVSMNHWVDMRKEKMLSATDRGHVLRQAIHSYRKGGTVSKPGVYGGFLDKIPIGSALGKALRIRRRQTHIHKCLPRLLDYILKDEIDPTFLITRRMPVEKAADIYQILQNKEGDCIKVVLSP